VAASPRIRTTCASHSRGRFRRPAGLLPLPLPQRGGSLEPLASLLNLANRNESVLVVAWLVAALRPSGPTHCWPFPGDAAVILSGIEEVISRPDLARSIFLTLALLPEALRRSDRDLWQQFEPARPSTLGANPVA
jgi:hypothetical protein